MTGPFSSRSQAGHTQRSPANTWPEIIGVLFLVIVFLGDARLLDPANFISGIDVDYGHFWYKTYLQERMRPLELPLWAPNFFAGHPFVAYPEMCVFYPGVFLFVLLPVPLAFTLNSVLHLWIAALGARALVRWFTPSRAAGLVGAICYAFGGYMGTRLQLGHVAYVQSAAWLPWVVWAFYRAHQSHTWRDRAISGVFFALLILASPPHNAMYALVLIFVQMLVAIAKPWTWVSVRRGVATAFVGVSFGLMLAAVQVLPTVEFARLTDRTQTSYDFATFLSLPPTNLADLLVPGLVSPWVSPNREFGFSAGAGGLALALLWMLSKRVWRQAAALPIAAVFALTLAMGRYLPFYAWYLRVLPVLGIFRVPARAEIVVAMSLAVMAGLALGEREQMVEGGNRRFEGLGIILLLCLAAMLALTGMSLPLARSGLVIAVTLALLRASVALPHRSLAGIVPLVLFLELYSENHSRVPISDSREFAVSPDPRHLAPSAGAYRVFTPFESLLDRGLFFHYEDTNGYAPLMLARHYRLMLALSGSTADPFRRHLLPAQLDEQPHPRLASLFSVRYASNSNGDWHEYASPAWLPRAHFVDHVTIGRDAETQLAMVIDDATDLATTAVVDSIPSPLVASSSTASPTATPSTSVAEIVRYAPERLEIRVDTDRARLLVLSELNYPGWRAEVDGRPTPIITANYAFRGVAVSPGARNVVFTFEPTSLVVGGVISVAALGVVLLILLRASKRDRGVVAVG